MIDLHASTTDHPASITLPVEISAHTNATMGGASTSTLQLLRLHSMATYTLWLGFVAFYGIHYRHKVHKLLIGRCHITQRVLTRLTDTLVWDVKNRLLTADVLFYTTLLA